MTHGGDDLCPGCMSSVCIMDMKPGHGYGRHVGVSFISRFTTMSSGVLFYRYHTMKYVWRVVSCRIEYVPTMCSVMGVVHRMVGPECPEVSAHVFDLLKRP